MATLLSLSLIHIYHTPNTVFEVLLFAIARQIIVEHSSAWSSLIGVCAIAVLFATRKFLFSDFDVSDETVFRATTKAGVVNKILEISIPHEEGDTLKDVLTRRCEEEDIEIGVGTCVRFSDFGLRVAKMHEGKISRIEVIRAIPVSYTHLDVYKRQLINSSCYVILRAFSYWASITSAMS